MQGCLGVLCLWAGLTGNLLGRHHVGAHAYELDFNLTDARCAVRGSCWPASSAP